jgi:hypothetical protein
VIARSVQEELVRRLKETGSPGEEAPGLRSTVPSRLCRPDTRRHAWGTVSINAPKDISNPRFMGSPTATSGRVPRGPEALLVGPDDGPGLSVVSTGRTRGQINELQKR